jgi:hypothetical protein
MIPVIYPVVCPLSYPILTPAHVQFTTTSYPNHIFTFIINLVYSIFFLLFIHSIIADIITYGFTLGYISLAMLRSGSLALVCLLLCAPRVSALLDSSSIFCITHLASIYLQFKRSSICLVSLGSGRVHTLSSLDISRLASDVTSNRSDSLLSTSRNVLQLSTSTWLSDKHIRSPASIFHLSIELMAGKYELER